MGLEKNVKFHSVQCNTEVLLNGVDYFVTISRHKDDPDEVDYSIKEVTDHGYEDIWPSDENWKEIIEVADAWRRAINFKINL